MDPTLADRARAKERGYVPPFVNGDFYRITDLLDQKERAVVKRVRDFMEAAVAPIIDSKSGPAFDALIAGHSRRCARQSWEPLSPLLRRARSTYPRVTEGETHAHRPFREGGCSRNCRE